MASLDRAVTVRNASVLDARYIAEQDVAQKRREGTDPDDAWRFTRQEHWKEQFAQDNPPEVRLAVMTGAAFCVGYIAVYRETHPPTKEMVINPKFDNGDVGKMLLDSVDLNYEGVA